MYLIDCDTDGKGSTCITVITTETYINADCMVHPTNHIPVDFPDLGGPIIANLIGTAGPGDGALA